MVKRLLVSAIVVFCMSTRVHAQFQTTWERCVRTGALDSKPTWFGTGTERGMAYANLGSNPRLYVVSRNGGSSIKVLNAETGSDVTLATPFDMTGVTGGLYALNDIEVTSDGVFIAANMTTDARATAFKLYVWTTEGGAWTDSLVAPYVGGAAAVRLGDKITVTGSWTAGTVEVYAAAASQNPARIYRYRTTDQGGTWLTDSIQLSGTYASTVASPAVAPLGVGSDFYVVGNGALPRKHTSSGAYVASSLMPDGSLSSSKGSIKHFSSGGADYVATYGYRPDPTEVSWRNGHGQIYNVTNPTAVTVYGRTDSLGNVDVANASNGDVAVRTDHLDGTITLYVLATDLGIAAFRTNTLPLPVQFSSMTARATAVGAEIVWTTANEVDNAGFEVERRAVDSRLSSVASSWTKIGFVAGAGTSTSPREYSYADAPAPGRYAYRLKQVDRDGSSTYYGEAEVLIGAAPKAFTLGEAYPNPFNPSTTLEFTVPEDGQASLKVYNMLGEEVSSLFSGAAKAGFVNRVTFDASGLTSGIYVYRLQTASGMAAKRMMLVK